MSWMSRSAEALSIGTHPSCLVGHDKHEHHIVDIDLHGRPPTIPDYPGVPEDLRVRFKIGAWDSWLYADSHTYCQGDGVLSKSLDSDGVWESYDTVLWLKLLSTGEGAVIDFGANAGWYTHMSALNGHEVLAVEADDEFVRLLRVGIEANRIQDMVYVAKGWVGGDSPVLSAEDAPRVRLVKADVEGQEDKCMRVCGDLFAAKKIDYAMIEVTPSFRDNYPDLIRWVQGFGYNAYIVPDKAWSHGQEGALKTALKKYEDDPLGVTRSRLIVNPEEVQSLHQVTVLFEAQIG